MARDRRVLITAVVSPLISVLVTFMGFGKMASDIEPVAHGAQSSRSGAARSRTSLPVLAILSTDGSEQLVERLRSRLRTGRLESEVFTRLASAESEMAGGRCGLILIPPEGADRDVRLGKSITWTFHSTPGKTPDPDTRAMTADVLRSLDEEIRRSRLEEHGLDPEATMPWSIVTAPHVTGDTPVHRESPPLLSLLLPYIMVLAAFFGGVPGAFDMVAGEKERGTLETLLVSPIERRSIVFGKFLAVFLVCTLAACSALLGVVVAVNGNFEALRPLFGQASLSFSAIMRILLTFLPLNVTFAAALLVVSTFARNQREAQSYLMPLTLLVVIPAMFTFFSGFGDRTVRDVTALIPVYSSSNLIRMTLDQGASTQYVAITVLSSSVYALFALWLATRMFLRERVLMRA